MRFIPYFLISACFLLPNISSAVDVASQCSSSGYTVVTLNGVLTDDVEARKNKEELRIKLPLQYKGEPLIVDYLLNPSHLGGIGDFIKVIYQKFFEKETVRDYDLVEMLDDASSKVKTQKLLLVAHSQGNFYANSFYDVVAGQQGGLPVQAIGVYGVASPASRVAGGGKWLTSDTDHVVVGLVDRVAFFRKIMPPNTHIAEVSGGFDPFSGHSFSDVYLRYRAQQIVLDIRSSLDSLSSDLERREDTVCIDPPKLTFVHNLEGAVLAVADTIIDTTKGALSESYYVLANSIAWVYNTSLAALSSAYSGAVSLLGGTGSLSEKNPASVILATLPPEKSLPTQESAPSLAPENNKETVIAKPSLVTSAPEVIASKQAPAILSPSIALSVKQTTIAPNTTTSTNTPKLVFVGLSPGFGGGMPAQAAPQVLGTTTETTETANEETTSFNEESDLPLLSLSAPAVSAPQCAFSLATHGCLIATTTVRFEWGAVSGATHYALNKNGVFATTTDTAIDVIADDFSEYTFGVAAIGPNNESSATSTQTVSVATIPIAINEIAWMGTSASSNDEWFEIKNNTAHTIDLSQWELNAKDGTPHVKLAGSIAPHEYLVFERTDDTVVADVKAHQIYTGALGDSGEQLSLSYASTTLDQTPDSAWIKGKKEGKKTMERYSSKDLGTDPLNWGQTLFLFQVVVTQKGILLREHQAIKIL